MINKVGFFPLQITLPRGGYVIQDGGICNTSPRYTILTYLINCKQHINNKDTHHEIQGGSKYRFGCV